MQLLISLCISLQFYLQFLQFLLLHIARCTWGHGRVYLLASLWSILHVAYLVIHFSLPLLHASLSRGGRNGKSFDERKEAGKNVIKINSNDKSNKSSDCMRCAFVDGAVRQFLFLLCPPAISIIREIEEVCGCRGEI